MIYLIRLSAIVVVLVSVFANIAVAQFGAGWMKTPQIVVFGLTDDPRQPLVDEAVVFWNKTLEELGSGFRLGTITRHAGSVAGDKLARMSNQVVESTRRHNFALPNAIINIPAISLWCSAMRNSFLSPPLLLPIIAAWSPSAGSRFRRCIYLTSHATSSRTSSVTRLD
jgi:hypothetical protein